MQGEQSNEEKLALEAKIKQLTKELEEKTATHELLMKQLRRLQDDVRQVKRDLEKTSSAKKELTSKIEELDLHNVSSQRQLNNQIQEKQVKLSLTLTLILDIFCCITLFHYSVKVRYYFIQIYSMVVLMSL